MVMLPSYVYKDDVPHLVTMQQVMVMVVNGLDGVNADSDVSTLNCNSLKTRIFFNLYLNPSTIVPDT